MEVSAFGIRTLSLDLGGFASDLLGEKAISAIPPTAHYQEAVGMLTSFLLPHLQSSPALDVSKVANLIVDLVKGEGVAKGKEIRALHAILPKDLFDNGGSLDEVQQSMPVGLAALEFSKGHCESWIRTTQTWREAIVSADASQAEKSLTLEGNGDVKA